MVWLQIIFFRLILDFSAFRNVETLTDNEMRMLLNYATRKAKILDNTNMNLLILVCTKNITIHLLQTFSKKLLHIIQRRFYLDLDIKTD